MHGLVVVVCNSTKTFAMKKVRVHVQLRMKNYTSTLVHFTKWALDLSTCTSVDIDAVIRGSGFPLLFFFAVIIDWTVGDPENKAFTSVIVYCDLMAVGSGNKIFL